MTLRALQRDFGSWLRTGSDAAMARIGRSHAPGLRVYQNNYRAQLAACLEGSFPHTLAWIGGSVFHDAAVAHIARVPPSSWTLDAYPQGFPQTLSALFPADPEIAELAWIEQALAAAFVGADAPAVDPGSLGEVDWDTAVLRFTPTLRHHPLATNAPAIWAALDAGDDPPASERLSEPGAILVWRQAHVSRFRATDAGEFRTLLRAVAGVQFAELCASLVQDMGENEGIVQAGTLLGRWLAEGLLSGIAHPLPASPG